MNKRDRVLMAGAISAALLFEKTRGNVFTEEQTKRALGIASWAADEVKSLFPEDAKTNEALLDLGERIVRGEIE